MKEVLECHVRELELCAKGNGRRWKVVSKEEEVRLEL